MTESIDITNYKAERLQLLKPQNAAQVMDVSRGLVLRWIKEGRLNAVVLGYGPKGNRILRIALSELERFITTRETTVPKSRSVGRIAAAKRRGCLIASQAQKLINSNS